MAFSRRSFLVLAGGSILGRFALPGSKALPDAPTPQVSGGPYIPTSEELANARRLIIPPQWSECGTVMVWIEERDEAEDGREIMVWRPETPKEWEEAGRFCEIANFRTWHTFEELQSQPRQPGRFVVRWIFQPRTCGYLKTTDEEILFSSEQHLLCTHDLRAAASFEHHVAIDLIPRLMEHFDVEESSMVYYDTIRFTEAVRSDLQYLQSKET